MFWVLKELSIVSITLTDGSLSNRWYLFKGDTKIGILYNLSQEEVDSMIDILNKGELE